MPECESIFRKHLKVLDFKDSRYTKIGKQVLPIARAYRHEIMTGPGVIVGFDTQRPAVMPFCIKTHECGWKKRATINNSFILILVLLRKSSIEELILADGEKFVNNEKCDILFEFQ